MLAGCDWWISIRSVDKTQDKRPRVFFRHEYFSSRCGVKSFRNLLQNGDGTSAKKLVEGLDILWASKDGNVDLLKWSKDDYRYWFDSR